MSSVALVVESMWEWTAAREVQQRFMQQTGLRTGTPDYSGGCRQVHGVGGDFYDFLPLPDNHLALALGDASGKGLAAALMITNVQSSLRTAALFAGDRAAEAVELVNRQVYASSLEDRYATLFYGVFHRETRLLRYVNAGHNPPMIIRRDGSIIWLETGGAPVGMFPDWQYEEATVSLNPGDIVVACSDGIFEAANAAGDEWGTEGVYRTASRAGKKSADEIVQAIFSSMEEFSQGHQADDASVMVLRVP
jgi:sigma-B regulation protein RsbU (phosphoserine phosphatase)